jgi:hypothetical protein
MVTVSDEPETMWKEAVVDYLRYPSIRMEGLRKTTKDNCCASSRDGRTFSGYL